MSRAFVFTGHKSRHGGGGARFNKKNVRMKIYAPSSERHADTIAEWRKVTLIPVKRTQIKTDSTAWASWTLELWGCTYGI